MKTKIIILVAAFGLALSACTGKKADQENADSTYKYTDTTKVIDSTSTDAVADSTTNAPADIKH
ncbi:protein involved in sex pheromone biosynthesis [Pedobacter sp. AK013]|uniref:entericidin n=1 Tax=Pedobacter sp. AK013 TaxID=2723071 RepID=UPI001613C6AB|nr:entericidin [Pedobacter sp. AK013]MBB6238467.1 protein involved in sex pheromone biosynthesis [Pedobacter sp. AK013]